MKGSLIVFEICEEKGKNFAFAKQTPNERVTN
jgi:hypothetical protein